MGTYSKIKHARLLRLVDIRAIRNLGIRIKLYRRQLSSSSQLVYAQRDARIAFLHAPLPPMPHA